MKSDYQIRSRIPQETADKLFQVIKELQEVTEVADVTISSVVRASLESFMNEYETKENKIKFEFNKSDLKDKDLDNFISDMKALLNNTPDNSVLKVIYKELYRKLLMELASR